MPPEIVYSGENGRSTYTISASVHSEIFESGDDVSIVNTDALLRSKEFKYAFDIESRGFLYYEVFSFISFSCYWAVLGTSLAVTAFFILFSPAMKNEVGKNITTTVLYGTIVIIAASSLYSLGILTKLRTNSFNLILKFYPYGCMRFILASLLAVTVFFTFLSHTNTIAETQAMFIGLLLFRVEIPLCTVVPILLFVLSIVVELIPGRRKRERYVVSFVALHLCAFTFIMYISLGLYRLGTRLMGGSYVLGNSSLLSPGL